MAYRRRGRSSRKSYAPSYRSRSRRRQTSGRTPRGQTLRIQLQQPGMQMQQPRSPFGNFQFSSLFNPMLAGMTGMGYPGPHMMDPGHPGMPGARMVIRPTPHAANPSGVAQPGPGGFYPSGFQARPGDPNDTSGGAGPS